MKTGFYMRAGDDQFSGWTEKKLQSTSLPKPDLHQKKVMVTVGWSASGLMHYSFLNPGETVTSEKYTEQFSETHRKPQCLQLPLVNRKGPVLSSTQMHITQQHIQSWTDWAPKFASSAIFTWPLANWLLKHLDSFLQGNYFHNQQEAENAFEEFVESRSTNFYATGINKLISHW